MGGCGESDRKQPARMAVYRGEGFSIALPADWHQERGRAAAIRAIGPIIPDSDGFRESVNVGFRYRRNVSLESIVSANRRSMENEGFRMESSRRIKVRGRDAHRLVFTGQVGRSNVKMLACLIASERRIYTIMCTTKERLYQSREPLFEDIVQSWTEQ